MQITPPPIENRHPLLETLPSLAKLWNPGQKKKGLRGLKWAEGTAFPAISKREIIDQLVGLTGTRCLATRNSSNPKKNVFERVSMSRPQVNFNLPAYPVGN